MLQLLHRKGYCHWGIDINKIELNDWLMPINSNLDKLHKIETTLKEGLRCHYKLPETEKGDALVDLSCEEKKAVDSYMLGVILYRILTSERYPYEKT